MKIYIYFTFPRSNSCFLLCSGNASQSVVLRFREEIFLVDAGLGTPRMSMQDEPTGVPINRATRFENKVGSTDVVAGESLIKKRILERLFINLVAGESLIKERAAARFNSLVGSTDVVAGEPLLLLPRRFRQNRAWMELNKIWRTSTRVKGFFFSKVKGGYSAAIAGLIPFLPPHCLRIANDRFIIESIKPKGEKTNIAVRSSPMLSSTNPTIAGFLSVLIYSLTNPTILRLAGFLSVLIYSHMPQLEKFIFLALLTAVFLTLIIMSRVYKSKTKKTAFLLKLILSIVLFLLAGIIKHEIFKFMAVGFMTTTSVAYMMNGTGADHFSDWDDAWLETEANPNPRVESQEQEATSRPTGTGEGEAGPSQIAPPETAIKEREACESVKTRILRLSSIKEELQKAEDCFPGITERLPPGQAIDIIMHRMSSEQARRGIQVGATPRDVRCYNRWLHRVLRGTDRPDFQPLPEKHINDIDLKFYLFDIYQDFYNSQSSIGSGQDGD